MDPLTIPTGVLGMVKTCGAIALGLKELHEGAQSADARSQALIGEVEDFARVLHLMNATLQDEHMSGAFQTTGHIGSHWRHVAACLEDGQLTLDKLRALVVKAGKSVKVLDETRRHLRLKTISEEVGVYLQRIRTCRDTVQLSLETVGLWHQVTYQQSVDRIFPELEKISRDIRTLARQVNSQTDLIRQRSDAPSTESFEQLRSLEKMKACVKTAADIVSSASTALGLSDRASTVAASDFEDVFPSQMTPAVDRWLSSNAIAETNEEEAKEDKESTSSALFGAAKSPSPHLDICGLGDSDSDGELEMEMVQAHIQKGVEELMADRFNDAEQHLQLALLRLRRNEARFRNTDTELDLLNKLVIAHRANEDWQSAKIHAMERPQVLSRSQSFQERPHEHLDATWELAYILYRAGLLAEARVYTHKCVKAYRRMGTEGYDGLKRSYELRVDVCRADSDLEGEASYKPPPRQSS